MSKKTLRILMILHLPWSRELGAPRVSLEIADEFEKLGHTVEKFDIKDAFPTHTKIGSFFEQARFASKAVRYVRANAHRFDVIQAEQGNLPASKKQLGFKGVLVARSNGLAHFYEAYEAEARKKDRQLGIKRGTFMGNALRAIARWYSNGLVDVDRSFQQADAIILINRDEFGYVVNKLGHSTKSHLFPNGMSEERFDAFARQAVSAEERLSQQRVAFVGRWSTRKGADDLPEIVRLIRTSRPETKFLFLGTGLEESDLRLKFAEADRHAIENIRHYKSEELPSHLRMSTVGILPSYIEGFMIGVLECCAAGIPSVCYDVPGPREILGLFDRNLLAPAGNIPAIANFVTELLALDLPAYTSLSDQSKQIASRFRWKDVAGDMLNLYYKHLRQQEAGSHE